MIIIDLVLVLVLGLEGLVLVLGCLALVLVGLVLILVLGLECLVLVLEGQVLVNITAYMCTMSKIPAVTQIFKWLIVAVTKGVILSSKCIIKCLAVGLSPNPLAVAAHSVIPDSLAGLGNLGPRRGRDDGEREGISPLLQTDLQLQNANLSVYNLQQFIMATKFNAKTNISYDKRQPKFSLKPVQQSTSLLYNKE